MDYIYTWAVDTLFDIHVLCTRMYRPSLTTLTFQCTLITVAITIAPLPVIMIHGRTAAEHVKHQALRAHALHGVRTAECAASLGFWCTNIRHVYLTDMRALAVCAFIFDRCEHAMRNLYYTFLDKRGNINPAQQHITRCYLSPVPLRTQRSHAHCSAVALWSRGEEGTRITDEKRHLGQSPLFKAQKFKASSSQANSLHLRLIRVELCYR